MDNPESTEKNLEPELDTKSTFADKNQETQTVFKIFGIELTAPSKLKNPRTIYLLFIITNILLFILLKNFISLQ